jgi:hypothetical protein
VGEKRGEDSTACRVVSWAPVSWPRLLGVGLIALVLLPVGAATGCAVLGRPGNWWEARRDASGHAPDPAIAREAVIQVYAARTVGIRGALGVHSWIAVKRNEAPSYTRYEVIGWGVGRGAPAVRVNRSGPDNYWFGSRPEKLVDLRGPDVDALIARVEEAIRSYPYPDTYRTWPGPNSNTFVAHVARAIPELRVHLPPTAIGKDYLPDGTLIAWSPSGTGVQISVFGLLGLLVGIEEGIEVNVLGLTLGLDVIAPALKLPGVGRLGLSPWPAGSQPSAALPVGATPGAAQAEMRR